jgi:hypothetical protein
MKICHWNHGKIPALYKLSYNLKSLIEKYGTIEGYFRIKIGKNSGQNIYFELPALLIK